MSIVAALLLGAAFGCGDRDQPPRPESASVEGVKADGAHRPLVLVVVDTVRADHLGIYGYERATMPELARRSQSGAVFERAFASSSWTLPSFASMYTGEHPARHGAGRHLIGKGNKLTITGIDAEIPTLAERLRDAGYATAAFVNNPFLSRQFGVARGFALYSYEHVDNQNIRSAAETVDLALEWIAAHEGEAFFVMVHLFDPHMDYAPPEDVAGRFTRALAGAGKFKYPVTGLKEIRLGRRRLDYEARSFIRGAYDEELYATDRELGRFLDALDTQGLFDEGVVIVTSDHGEELFDHGNFEHGHTTYQELLHVPLVIWGPQVAPQRIRDPVSHVDLFATALELAGRDVPQGVAGESLAPRIMHGEPLPARPIVADRTLHSHRHRVLVQWPWKLIEVDGRPHPMLFNLENDPLELGDLAAREPDRVREMREELARVSPRDAASARESAEALDAAIRGQLEALGYVAPEDE